MLKIVLDVAFAYIVSRYIKKIIIAVPVTILVALVGNILVTIILIQTQAWPPDFSETAIYSMVAGIIWHPIIALVAFFIFRMFKKNPSQGKDVDVRETATFAAKGMGTGMLATFGSLLGVIGLLFFLFNALVLDKNPPNPGGGSTPQIAQQESIKTYSGNIEDAKRAYDTGDFAEARRLYLIEAEKGELTSQLMLGTMSALGEGVPQDYTEAGKWYGLAAEQGDVNAQSVLGVMYINGDGMPQDFKEAAKWFRLAAQQGEPKSQSSLGFMYSNGQGVPQDYTEAMKWYRQAAEQGDATAQVNLGKMYDFGQGVSQDYKEAVKFYRLAAEQGDSTAQFSLGVMYEDGKGVSQDFKQAVNWYRLAALQGKTTAQFNLGVRYFLGEGVPQSYEDAYAWWAVAAANGDANAKVIIENAQNGKMTPTQIERGQQIAKEIWAKIEAKQ